MFVTDHASKLDAPHLPGARDLSYWHTAELAFNDVWFMAAVCQTNRLGEDTVKDVRTLLLNSFSGVQQCALAEDECRNRLLHVDVVTPDFVNGTNGWKIDRLFKVWAAIDPTDPIVRPLVYETQGGDRYADSLIGKRVDDLVIESLVLELPNLNC